MRKAFFKFLALIIVLVPSCKQPAAPIVGAVDYFEITDVLITENFANGANSHFIGMKIVAKYSNSEQRNVSVVGSYGFGDGTDRNIALDTGYLGGPSPSLPMGAGQTWSHIIQHNYQTPGSPYQRSYRVKFDLTAAFRSGHINSKLEMDVEISN
jgi:hypothetical protein